MTASYNLTKEPWIPCVTLEGEFKELSLHELFAQAHELRGIEDDNPLIVASIYRLLLAIIHRAINGPKSNPEWKVLWRSKYFDERITEYLDKWETRFDLFSETYPFYQTPGIQVVRKQKNQPEELVDKTVLLLNLAAATGNNKTLFSHTLESNQNTLSASSAVRFLLVSQQYSLSGLAKININIKTPASDQSEYQGNYRNGPLAGKLMTLILGKTLYETLILNLLIYTGDHPIPKTNDQLVWELDEINTKTLHEKRAVSGYLELLTWKSRHVWLMPNQKTLRIQHLQFAQGLELPSVLDKNYVHDPLCWYREEKKPFGLNPARAYWRDSSTLFQFVLDSSKKSIPPYNLKALPELLDEPPRQLLIIGLSNDQANPLLWRQEILPLPNGILNNHSLVRSLTIWLQYIEEIHEALKNSIRYFAGQLLTSGLRKIEPDDVTRMVNSLNTLQEFWIQMEPLFQEFMKGLNESTDLIQWTNRSKRVANDIFIKTTDNALSHSQRELRARVLAEKKLNDDLKKIGQPVKEVV